MFCERMCFGVILTAVFGLTVQCVPPLESVHLPIGQRQLPPTVHRSAMGLCVCVCGIISFTQAFYVCHCGTIYAARKRVGWLRFSI